MKDLPPKAPKYMLTDEEGKPLYWNCHAETCKRGFWEEKHLKTHLGNHPFHKLPAFPPRDAEEGGSGEGVGGLSRGGGGDLRGGGQGGRGGAGGPGMGGGQRGGGLRAN